MVKFINSWAQGIILAVIISTIIEIILPEGNNKKYIKTIIGIYILFTIVYPLFTKISNKDFNINSIITSTNQEISKYEIKTNNSLETNNYIENIYKAKIEEDIKNRLLEKGYEVNLLNLYIETQNEENYAQIKEIRIQIEKKDNKNTSNTINQISKVEININSNNGVEKNDKQENEKINDTEIQSLKQYLNTTYGVEENKIYINE